MNVETKTFKTAEQAVRFITAFYKTLALPKPGAFFMAYTGDEQWREYATARQVGKYFIVELQERSDEWKSIRILTISDYDEFMNIPAGQE